MNSSSFTNSDGVKHATYGDLRFHRIAEFVTTVLKALISMCCVNEKSSHCIFVNNCVGVRNRKYFIGFLISASLMCIYGGIASLYCLYQNSYKDPGAYEIAFRNRKLFFVGLVLTCLGVLFLWYFCLRYISFRREMFKSLFYMLITFAGVCCLAVFFWKCIGFESIYKTPVPFAVAVACVVYGGWYTGFFTDLGQLE